MTEAPTWMESSVIVELNREEIEVPVPVTDLGMYDLLLLHEELLVNYHEQTVYRPFDHRKVPLYTALLTAVQGELLNRLIWGIIESFKSENTFGGSVDWGPLAYELNHTEEKG